MDKDCPDLRWSHQDGGEPKIRFYLEPPTSAQLQPHRHANPGLSYTLAKRVGRNPKFLDFASMQTHAGRMSL